MSHGLTVMAPSGFLSRLTKCAESRDLRLESLDVRKATLAKVLARAAPGLRLNQHMEKEDRPLVFHHACKLGLEGIVSKRKDSRYRSGRSPHWIKSKNPHAPS
jgi:bifunctional non-homologous end joining protein LigD